MDTTRRTRSRLAVMMFLEYVIWGSWLPLLALYLTDVLHFSGAEIGWVFATPAVACVVGLFAGGQVADRLLSTERMLAICQVIGGTAMFALAWQRTFWPFLLVMLVHQLAFIPTVALTNAVVFHNVADARKDFGPMRMWGTIGWIAASWPFVFLLAGKTGDSLHTALGSIFIVAGVASYALAAFAFLLPRTPPSPGVEGNAPLTAIKLLAVPSLAVLFVVTLLDALVHQCYFQWTSPFLERAGLPANWIMAAMSIGQVAEIVTMGTLGAVLARFGWRATLALGIAAHAARFFIYAIGDPLWLMVAVNLVHGMCYAFYFAAVYIYVDEQFPKDARTSAQGLFNLLILGVGPFAGSLLWGGLGDRFRTAAGEVDFQRLFLVPAWLGVAAMVLLLVAFHPRAVPAASADTMRA
ncbi:MAG: MFS transporter [Acidobacteria bacterium]|nr:MFS transporter [Acidobacteriota bacterium]